LGNPFRQVKGNLRFPLTYTYHGCPWSFENGRSFESAHTLSRGRSAANAPAVASSRPSKALVSEDIKHITELQGIYDVVKTTLLLEQDRPSSPW